MISSVVVKIRNKFHVIVTAFDDFIGKTKRLFWSNERKNEAEFNNIKFYTNPQKPRELPLTNGGREHAPQTKDSTTSTIRDRLDSSTIW